jgi:isopentenyl diphosphate isomerase/L-lactate dehydrogenase-like FMN-dependent dehydrogenase
MGKVKEAGYRGFGSRSITRCWVNALQTAFCRLRKRWQLVWAGKRRRSGRLEARIQLRLRWGRVVTGELSPYTTWEELAWIKKEWGGPVMLKGIQCAEDAKLACEYECQGVLLSDHEGRQLHSAPSALITLLEIRSYCSEILLGKTEIYLDGGLRDGSDVLKALCLGATAVEVGRPFLYALAAYGLEGGWRDMR